MPTVALTGGAYQARSVIASAQRSVNLYAEPMPEAQGEPGKAAHYPTPGLRFLSTIGTGPIRGIRRATTGALFVVSGQGVYIVDTNTWAGTHLGDITYGLRTPVGMADNGLDMVIVDGSSGGWHVTLAGNAFAAITDDGGMFSGGDRVDFLDTYLLFNKPNTPQFYSSDSLALTFDPLWFANKEAYSDLLRTLVVVKRDIWLLGEMTTEVWADVGKEDFPFESQPDVFIDHGIAAKYSVANYDNALFWLCNDRQGHGFVIQGAGYQTKRISTYAIEAEIARYPRIDDAIGFTYLLAGHAFYVIAFPAADKTWSYDITTGHWHEWVWIDANGAEHRHRANCCWPVDGVPIVGDWRNGNIYALDLKQFTDNGQPIKRLRSFPHGLNEGKRLFFRQFLADFDTGEAPQQITGTVPRLSASFTAADNTNLSAYVSDVGGGWTAIGGAAAGIILGGRLTGSGGAALYQSAALILKPDMTLRFDVVPSSYVIVPSATTISAIGRATGADTGYRVSVTADGARYSLTLDVPPSGISRTVVMGTLTSGVYTVFLVLRGSTIAAQVQRSADRLWLRGDGTWQSNPGTTAAQFSDTTYAAPGVIMVGGTWPTPAVVTPPSLSYTMETVLSGDPNFPTGYSLQALGTQTFDFQANLFYQAISGGGNGGIAITDLNTMHVTRTVTLSQMFAGTPYGHPAGTPPSQVIYGLTADPGGKLYMLMDSGLGGTAGVYCRFNRVDPVTMKVDGEWFVSATAPPPMNCVMPGGWQNGIVNHTANHTVVLYPINGSRTLGTQLVDGTNMAPIGLGPTPMTFAYNTMFEAAKRYPDGSCDFVMFDPDSWLHPTSGNIDIWRIHVTDGLVVTSTKTGTLSVLPYFTPPSTTNRLFVGQVEYDPIHDTFIVTVPDATVATTPSDAPSWLLSVNWNGTVNWAVHQTDASGIPYGNSEYNMTDSTYMAGDSTHLHLYDTGTGVETFHGSILVSGSSAGSFFRVWDATRQAYWTYALSRGFVRINFDPGTIAQSLSMDDLVVTATAADLDLNQISLRWSDDRGHSFGSPVLQDIGEVGQYRTSLQWQRLGYARDRIFEISWSVPMPTALQGCWVDVTSGQS